MLRILSHNWWVVALRGAVAILFGILTLLFPGLALQTLVLLFGLYALIDGISMALISIQNRKQQGWWVHLLEGLVGILAGILAVAYPGITALILLYIIAVWAIMTGVFEIWAAITLRREIAGELWLGLSGLLSIVFGVVLIVAPGAGALAVLWLIGIYAIVFGAMLVLLALRVRGMRDHTPTQAGAT